MQWQSNLVAYGGNEKSINEAVIINVWHVKTGNDYKSNNQSVNGCIYV